jgi:hypothetical protein
MRTKAEGAELSFECLEDDERTVKLQIKSHKNSGTADDLYS